MLLIFNKNFSKRYNLKKAIPTLLIYIILGIEIICRHNIDRFFSKNYAGIGWAIYLYTLVIFLISPFFILYSCNIKRGKTVYDKWWFKILLFILNMELLLKTAITTLVSSAKAFLNLILLSTSFLCSSY